MAVEQVANLSDGDTTTGEIYLPCFVVVICDIPLGDTHLRLLGVLPRWVTRPEMKTNVAALKQPEVEMKRYLYLRPGQKRPATTDPMKRRQE